MRVIRAFWAVAAALGAIPSASHGQQAGVSGASRIAEIERLSDDQADRVLRGAAAFQSRLEGVRASFVVSDTVNLATLSGSTLKAWPELAEAKGVVQGRIEWARDGAAERVDLTYEVTSSQARLLDGRYLARTVIATPEKTVTIFPLSKQALITEASGLAALGVPADWLIPGSREDLPRLRSQRATFEVYEVSSGRYLLRVSRPVSATESIQTDAVISQELDFAPIEWSSDSLGKHVYLEYARNAEGLVEPVEATCVSRDGSTSTIEVVEWQFGSPGTAPFSPAFPVGGLVTDATKNAAAPEIFEVQPSGVLKPVTASFRPAPRTAAATHVGTVAAVCLLITGIACLRSHYGNPLHVKSAARRTA